MLVPRLEAAGGVVELHEAHASLDQPARQQALAAEDVGRLLVDAVEPLRRLGLAGQVEGVGGLRSASERPARTIRSGPPAGCPRRGPSRCSSLSRRRASSSRRWRSGLDPVVLQVADRVAQVGDERPLVRRRQERGAVLPGALDQRARADRDEAGQVLVLGAQAVGHPGAQARPRGHPLARVHLQAAAGMVDVVGHHRADHAQLIDARPDVRETAR